ncbi:MAG: hypothetical protein P8X73_06120 [Ignavibacteriaceae bacterium]
MSIHKIILSSLLFVYSLLIVGCATSYAPDNWLPETDDVPQNTHGGWIAIVTQEINSRSDEEWIQYSGEFIALDDDNVYVLYDSLYTIPKNIIVNSVVDLDQKNTGVYAVWVTLGSLLTISNGAYGVITLPLWLFAGIPTASGESYRDMYIEENPGEVYWDNVNKFSRFPQGVVSINLSDLQPMFNEVE